MAALADQIFDSGLNQFNSLTENLYILSGDPGLTWGNIATLGLGSKAAPTVSVAADRAGGGREVTISAITDGNVTATGTASHYALTDDSATTILASGSLSASQSVTSGNTFTLTEFTIGIPDPA